MGRHAAAHTNRLISESSPYLLQHAHNPVEWYAWGEEAFRAARDENKPIFLSIGYSTCYWCHVMERECFENEAIAGMMNEHFINIKVDREERPDVDDVYMTATQLMTSSGGWPMSVWLEPRSLKPFLAGTYFPPDDRFGRPGFPRMLEQIAVAWRDQRDAIMQQAEQVAAAVKNVMEGGRGGDGRTARLSESHVAQAVGLLMRQYDREHGGFSGPSGPKFPTPVQLELLMGVAWARTGETPVPPDARKAVLHTLDRMAMGGMYDQIGGGFHRYSVDELWLVPHFEKMLYDNAQLAMVYARAFELTGDPFYSRIVRGVLEYISREMTDDGGGFWSAQDAEVNAREGQNYLWTATDVRKALADAGLDELIDFTLEVYGLSRGTNFRDPHHPEDGPKNVIHLTDRPDALAAAHGLTMEDFFARLDEINVVLLRERQKRDQPATDDKVLAGWNGLMIAAFAEGGRALREPKYTERAIRAAEFVLGTMRAADGGLRRSFRKGQMKIPGFAEDYAGTVHGLLALHTATHEERWLHEAESLAAMMRTRLFDDIAGGYFDAEEGASELFVRTKNAQDGAVPSANSLMALNLLDLATKTGNERYVDDAAKTLHALGRVISEHPLGAALGVLGLAQMLAKHPDRAASQQPSGIARPNIVRAYVERVDVDVVHVRLEIAPEFHINAHDPGQSGLQPLTVEAANRDEIEVEYPQGELWREGVRIHRGSVTVPVRFPIGGTKKPVQLIVTYQPCSEEACLETRREVVDG